MASHVGMSGIRMSNLTMAASRVSFGPSTVKRKPPLTLMRMLLRPAEYSSAPSVNSRYVSVAGSPLAHEPPPSPDAERPL